MPWTTGGQNGERKSWPRFGSLYFGQDANKLSNHPLTTPFGVKVTRSYPVEKSAEEEPVDHPHQKGLWIGVERLRGMDFWENDSSYTRHRMGKIVFNDVTKLEAAGNQGIGMLCFSYDDQVLRENQRPECLLKNNVTEHSGDPPYFRLG